MSRPVFMNAGVPLYYQLASILRQKIVGREIDPGDQLPPEFELAAEYGVSRVTVRQAMSNLEEEGLIRRQAGRGTFVNETSRVHQGDHALDRSIDDLIAMGRSTSVEIIDLQELKPPRRIAKDLALEEGGSVVRCQRIRHVGDEPYCYIVNWVTPEIGHRIDESHWQSGSVLQYIEEELCVPLASAHQRLHATLADAAKAAYLQVRIGAPLLVVDYCIQSAEKRPVEVAELHYRGESFTFSQELTHSGEQGDGWSLRRDRLEP